MPTAGGTNKVSRWCGPYCVAFAVVVVALLLMSLYLWVLKATFPLAEDRGLFGDSFGAVNALFSGLALAGVVASLFFQQRQNAIERFEGKFFQLLGLANQVTSTITMSKQVVDPPQAATNTGRAALSDMACIFQEMINGNANERIEIFGDFFDRFRHELGHYFRNWYSLMRFVDEADVEDKSEYTRVVRAQFSTDEQYLLFFNCLTKPGEKFKDLVEKYALLEHMRPEDISDCAEQFELYDKAAFGTDYKIIKDGLAASPVGNTPP